MMHDRKRPKLTFNNLWDKILGVFRASVGVCGDQAAGKIRSRFGISLRRAV